MRFLSIYLFLIVISLFGCLDTINFERPDTIENGIAIQGKLTKGNPSTIRVTIKELFNFLERDDLLNVQSVLLQDELGNEISISSSRDGIHEQVLVNFPIEYGVGYKVIVNTFDNRRFESSLESILPVPSPEKLEHKFVKRERINRRGQKDSIEVLSFNITTPLANNEDQPNSRILWELISTYKLTDDRLNVCYVDLPPFQNYIPFDGTNSTASEVEQSLFETLPLSIFAEGYYFSVLQQSLSETAYEYWSQVNIINNRTGNLFEPPIGNITTNFVDVNNAENTVYGFFYATEEKILRKFIAPEVVGNPIKSCPCDCFSTQGASFEKPPWWIE